MNYQEASLTAASVIKHLSPFCNRIEVAGSTRRLKADYIRDVEVVCIPKVVFDDGLFGPENHRPDPGFVAKVKSWEKVKGEPDGKYTQRILPNGVKLDLFIATPENWGMIYLIRTGSSDWVPKQILRRFRQRGFKCEGGVPRHLKTGEQLHFREEADVFSYLGLEFVPPNLREPGFVPKTLEVSA
ncbi:MAG: hypothetical protein AAF570_02005 [Bacteroidota bacterium]